MPNTTPNLGLIKPLVTEQYDIAKVTNENADILDTEIKAVKDDVLDKQDTLVSGTNIKSVNGSSILSSGDLELLPKNNPTATGTQTLPNIITNEIKFPATQVPSADPNTLDDYEEGTFTPNVAGSTTAGTGTYTANRYGKYTKIGNLVYVNIFIEWTAHTGTGNLRITGIPFSSSSYGTRDIPNILSNNLTANANHVITGEMPSNATLIHLIQYPTGGGAYSFIPMGTSAIIELSITYLTN